MWQPQPWEDHGGVLPDHQLARGEVPGDWRTCDGEDSVGDTGDGQYLPGFVLLYLQICHNCTTQYYQYYSTTTHYLSSIYTPDMISDQGTEDPASHGVVGHSQEGGDTAGGHALEE